MTDTKTEMEPVKDLELTIVTGKEKLLLENVVKKFDGLCLGMSRVQIEHGLLRNDEFPTESSKYWQCVREIYVRYYSLLDSQYQFNVTNFEIEDLTIKLSDIIKDDVMRKDKKDLEIRKLQNEIAYRKLKISSIKTNIEDSVRQIKIFNDGLGKYKGSIENYEKDQEDFWIARKNIVKLTKGIDLMPGLKGRNGDR